MVWLLRAQEPDGSWFGRWGANYVYGTGAVVPALIAAGVPAGKPAIRRAVRLARGAPEPGRRLGRGPALLRRPRAGRAGHLDRVADRLGAARAARRRDRRARPRKRASAGCTEHQRADGTWDEPQYTGTGFPGDFYINYHLYRLVFPLSALGRYLAGRRMTRPVLASPRTRPPVVEQSGLLVCAPLRLEARAVRRGLGGTAGRGGGHRVRAAPGRGPGRPRCGPLSVRRAGRSRAPAAG